MTNDITNNSSVTETNSRQGPSRLMLVGSVLWVMCLVGIAYGWYLWKWKQRILAAEAASIVNQSDDDNGRSPKQIKLVPQKDGSFLPVEVTKENEANPWDVDGIEDFSFTDSSGQLLTKKELLGKPFVIAFVFTKCLGPCPAVTLQMRELQERMKDYDFNLVTLTVDPARDTTDVLREYGEAQNADFDRWKFLTGDQRQIYGLIQRSFKMPVQETTGADRKPGFEIIHSTNIMLVDATGRVVGKYNAYAENKEQEMARLRKDLKNIATKRENTGKPVDEEGQR